MIVDDFSMMKPGVDVSDLKFFNINDLPNIAFYCHNKFINEFKTKEK